jgi:D-arabinose 5-phosphate isomerase GutQ
LSTNFHKLKKNVKNIFTKLGWPRTMPIMTDDNMWNSARKVWDIESAELSRISACVDPHSFAQCVRAISECRGRIVTSGCGTSATAARKIAHSLSCIERPSFFLSPSDAVHGALGSVQPGDIAVLISKGGGTRELLALLPGLQAKRVTIIAVTEKEDSPLAGKADILLKTGVEREADSFNMLATSSTMVVIALFDAVCIALMEHTGYTREQFAVIHPSGAVGERLLKGER